jgi:hypothetical protein
MPDHRLTPKREGFSDKINALDHLAYRVWQQYKLSADDYGVMPDLAASIQAGNRRLAKEPARAITACLNTFVDCGLLHRFTHQGQDYLYSRVWQEHQKVRYPSETFHPVPPADELAQCERKTRALFAQRSANVSEIDPKDSRESSSPPTRAHSRNALANANASLEGESEREPPRRPPDVPIGQLQLMANELVAEWNARVSPPLIPVTNPEPSKGRILNAVRLRPSMDEWREVLDRTFSSEYLMGQVPGRDGTCFALTFWWLLEGDHADKVLSGAYVNRPRIVTAANGHEGPRPAPTVEESNRARERRRQETGRV